MIEKEFDVSNYLTLNAEFFKNLKTDVRLIFRDVDNYTNKVNIELVGIKFDYNIQLDLDSINCKKIFLKLSNITLKNGFYIYFTSKDSELKVDLKKVFIQLDAQLNVFECDKLNFKFSACHFKELKVNLHSDGEIEMNNCFGNYIFNGNKEQESKIVCYVSDIKNVTNEDDGEEFVNSITTNNIKTVKIFYLRTVAELLQKPIKESYIFNNVNINQFKNVNIKDLFCNELKISPLNQDPVNLKINNSLIDKLTLTSATYNNLKLDNISSLSKRGSDFAFYHIRFKEASFYRVDFKSFQNFIARNVNLEAASFIACSNPNINPNKDFTHEDIYETYRQLKTAYQKNNNKMLELEAHAKMFEAAKNRTDLTDWDQFILWMNHHSNRNGTSIGQAVKVIALITFWTFPTLLLASYLSCGTKDVCQCFTANVIDRLSLIFTILNPLSRIEEYKVYLLYDDSMDLNFWQNFIIFFSKIAMSWAIYQFVAAFRKFGKQ